MIEEHKRIDAGLQSSHNALSLKSSDAYDLPKSFFFESEDSSYKPRAVLVDTDPDLAPSVVRSFSGSPISFDAESVLSYKQDCRANYFDGFSQGKSIAQDVVDQLLVHADRSDSVGGFFVYRSLGGGTGSGVGTLILEKIKDTFGPKSVVFEPLVFPSTDSSTSTVEPYNCMFGLSSSRQLVSLSLMLDNQAAFKMCRNRPYSVLNPSFSDVNNLISTAVSGCTSTLRFPSTLNASLDQIVMNLVPEQTFRYPTVSLCPSKSVVEGIASLFEPKNFLCDSPNLKLNRYFAASLVIRTTAVPADSIMAQVQRSLSSLKQCTSLRPSPVRFMPWIPNSFKIGLIHHNASSFMLLGNTTAVRSLFLREYKKFISLYYHRAYVWQFLEAGGEIDNFIFARDNILDLLGQYEQSLTAAASEETNP